MTKHKWILTNLLLLALMIGTAIIALNMGPTPASFFDTSLPAWDAIIWSARLPRILLALLVGIALGTSGTVYQSLLRNPLADPYILGVSGGAALGSAMGIGLGLPFPLIALLAFGVSLCTILGIVSLSQRQGAFSTYRLLLTGVVCNAFAFALIMAAQSVIPMERSHEILILLMGNLTLADNSMLVWLAAIILPGVALLMRYTRELDAWALGDDTAASLGINIHRLQRTLFILGSLVVGAAVAASGLIGFVGLFIPHAVRLVVGAQHRILLPAAGVVGGAFLVLADTCARTAFSGGNFQTELPVGVITALIGAPCFLWILKRREL